MSWISPHNLGSKASPASKQARPARFSPQPPRFASSPQAPPPQNNYASPGGWAPAPVPDMLLPDDHIPDIAPPPMLNKRPAPSPQRAMPSPQPRSQHSMPRSQQTIVQPQQVIRQSPSRVMRMPVRTQVVQAPMVQERFIEQPPVTEIIAPPMPVRSPMRPMMMGSPVRHSPMRMPHMMHGPPLPVMQDPYYEDIPFVPGGHQDETETDFDGPGFSSYGGMPEEYMMPPANYPGYMPTYHDPRGYYEEGVPEPPMHNGYAQNDHGLVPEVETYQEAPPPPPPPRHENVAPPPPRQDYDPPPPRQDPAPPPPRPDPAPAPEPPAPPPEVFASLPAPPREPIQGPDREEASKVKAAPSAPTAVRAAPPPAATMMRAAPPSSAAASGDPVGTVPQPPRPALSSQPQAAMPSTVPQARPSQPSQPYQPSQPSQPTSQPGQPQPYTDDLHEYEEDLIARIESTLAEANRTLEEHSNRYPVRGADGN